MVASEATPFCKTGGLADVLGALPPALQAAGDDLAVVLPAYRDNQYPDEIREVWRNLSIPLGPGYIVDLYQAVHNRVPYYFVHCPPLFDRPGFYNTQGADFPDNHMRFAVLSMAALGVARLIFRPQVIHCHDWQSGLVPVYLRRWFQGDPTFQGVPTLFTIHNLGYQGLFPATVAPSIGLDPRLLTPDLLEFYGQVNFLKGGVAFSDAVSTVSRGYAREIQTPEYGFGLDTFLRVHARRLTGIVNGVDYNEWNPETDRHIAKNYSVDDLSGKRDCKRALLDQMGLPSDDPDRPVIGMISRMIRDKGFDLVLEIAGELVRTDARLVILGSGDPVFERVFQQIAAAYPDRVAVRIGYDNPLAHRIEAGADLFLMPSRYEPCGLNQIYSLRYGTVPVVRATGGLDDTIDEETGFKFREYSGGALFGALQAALTSYQNRDQWLRMMRRGMQKDYSWAASAADYRELYSRLLG
jgi:starch synthase